jgi:hypothetical protein
MGYGIRLHAYVNNDEPKHSDLEYPTAFDLYILLPIRAVSRVWSYQNYGR